MDFDSFELYNVGLLQDLDSFDSFPIHNGNVCRERYSKLIFFIYYGFRVPDLKRNCIMTVSRAAVVIDRRLLQQLWLLIHPPQARSIILNVRRESGML